MKFPEFSYLNILQFVIILSEVFVHLVCVCELKTHSSIERFFVIELKNGTYEDAFQLATENHYKLLKEIRGFPNVFLLEKLQTQNTNGKRSGPPPKPLEFDERVLWSSQQKILRREKRDYIVFSLDELLDKGGEIADYQNFYSPLFNDELWSQQWYMQKSLNKSENPVLNLNVLPVYEKGFTGRGVRVAVLDDGLEYDHEDLIENYDPEISWDCNNDKPDPHPNYRDLSNRHGTRCAGEIAMIANNKKCGVGIAFNSKIGGIKLLGGHVYDLVEGMALGYRYNKVDIYSSSWGPTDNGKSLEKPGVLASLALQRGAHEGRGGLGSVYVWASGNGGARFDNCNCDGYAASIYTITIGSVTQHGNVPWYSEKCASIMAVTQSSGAAGDQMITTTDLGNSCTVQHTGTSASAPLAAGVIALGLEANPKLTWRDVQHIIVQTSSYTPLKFNEGWIRNAAGFPYHSSLGFGVMNADAFVSAALTWKTVPPKAMEKLDGYQIKTENSKWTNHTKVYYDYDNNDIRFLEHVEIVVNIQTKRRGNLVIFLISPRGTQIQILEKRLKDNSKDGFKNWSFLSVATWGEDPIGKWQMEIVDSNSKDSKLIVTSCTLILHGTRSSPTRKNSLLT